MGLEIHPARGKRLHAVLGFIGFAAGAELPRLEFKSRFRIIGWMKRAGVVSTFVLAGATVVDPGMARVNLLDHEVEPAVSA